MLGRAWCRRWVRPMASLSSGRLAARRRIPGRHFPFHLGLLRKVGSGLTAAAYLSIEAVQMRMRMKVLNTMRMHVHALGCGG